jgi:hypothetical protein
MNFAPSPIAPRGSLTHDIPVKCTRCRFEAMESEWLGKPTRARSAHIGTGIAISQMVCPRCGCTTYYDMRPQVAWCWANGLIEIGDSTPASSADGCGPIEIATGPKSALRAALEAVARHGRGRSAGQLLVPGVPEAVDQQSGGDALHVWLAWINRVQGKKRGSVWQEVKFRAVRTPIGPTDI